MLVGLDFVHDVLYRLDDAAAGEPEAAQSQAGNDNARCMTPSDPAHGSISVRGHVLCLPGRYTANPSEVGLSPERIRRGACEVDHPPAAPSASGYRSCFAPYIVASATAIIVFASAASQG